MRDFIMITERLIGADRQEAIPDEPVLPPIAMALMEELRQIVFKLRAYTDLSDDATAYGVETGMQRAAEMIEHIIVRHQNRLTESGEGVLGG
jgi:hypothetical protein